MCPHPRRRVVATLTTAAAAGLLLLLGAVPAALSASAAAPPSTSLIAHDASAPATAAGAVEQQAARRRQAPPRRVRAAAVRRASVTLAWRAAPGRNVRYRVLRNGRRVATTARTRILVRVACGRRHVLAVRAVRGGRVSRPVAIRVRTRPCLRRAPLPVTPTPPPAPPAPVEAPASLFVSSGGSDSSRCTASAPCRSFGRALDVASGGQVVEVAGGQYGSQRLSSTPAGPPVVFRPAAGASVRTGEIRVSGGNVEVRGVTASGWYAEPGARGVIFRSVTVDGGVYVSGAASIHMIGGSIGPGNDYNSEIKGDGRTAPRDIVFDGVTFHDWRRTDGESHVECLHVMAADGLTIRNSTFRNCEHFDVLFTVFGDAGSPRNVTVENNSLDCCLSGYYSLQFSGNHGERWENLLIRGNTMTKALNIGGDIVGNVQILGNTGPSLDTSICRRSGVTSTGNTWRSGSRCG